MTTIDELKIDKDNLKISYLPKEYEEQRQDLEKSLASSLMNLVKQRQFLLDVLAEADEGIKGQVNDDLKKVENMIIQIKGYCLHLQDSILFPEKEITPASRAMQEALERVHKTMREK